MMKPWIACAVVVITTVFCTGCWDSTEIDRLSIVTMSSVDLGADNKSAMGAIQIARASALGTSGGGAPSSSSGGTETFIVEKADGINNVAALEDARKRLSRRLFTGHRRVIIVGEEYAKHGVGDLMDEVIRNPRSRLRTYIIVAYHTHAIEVMKLPYPLNRLPSDAIVEIEEGGIAIPVDARKFLKQLTSHGDPIAMGIEIIPTMHEVSGKSKESFMLNNIAVFQKDKLVGWLEGAPAHGFLWLYGSLKQEDTTIRVPGHSGSVSARLGNTHTERSISMVSGKPQLNVRVQSEYDITQNATDMNLMEPQNMELVRSGLAKEITTQMKSTMHELQHTYQADSLDFSDKIYQRYPKVWATLEGHWRDAYATLPVTYSVQVRVRNSGLISSSLYTETTPSFQEGD